MNNLIAFPGQKKENGIRQILGREPSAFELELMQTNAALMSQLKSMKCIKIFDADEVDAQGRYQAQSLLILAGQKFVTRLDNVAHSRDNSIEAVISACLTKGLSLMEAAQESAVDPN